MWRSLNPSAVAINVGNFLFARKYREKNKCQRSIKHPMINFTLKIREKYEWLLKVQRDDCPLVTLERNGSLLDRSLI